MRERGEQIHSSSGDEERQAKDQEVESPSDKRRKRANQRGNSDHTECSMSAAAAGRQTGRHTEGDDGEERKRAREKTCRSEGRRLPVLRVSLTLFCPLCLSVREGDNACTRTESQTNERAGDRVVQADRDPRPRRVESSPRFTLVSLDTRENQTIFSLAFDSRSSSRTAARTATPVDFLPRLIDT